MTREEFLERIDEIMCGTSNAERAYLDDLYNEVTKPQWIKVEERKPKFKHKNDEFQYSETVIVTDGEYCTSASWVHNTWAGWYGWFERGAEELNGVTHWMPMPEAPTVAKNATVKEKGGEHDTEE